MTKKILNCFVSSMLVLLLLLFAAKPLLAQSQAALLDSLSYSQYLAEDWKSLIQSGKQMQKAGLDYYYMHMRLGIARMALNQQNQASTHFMKALQHKPFDTYAEAYLYESLLAAQQAVEAGVVYKRMTQFQAEIPSTNIFTPLSAHADVAYTFRNAVNGLEALPLTGNAGIFGQERSYGNNLFYDAGIHLLLNPRLIVYAGFQSIGMDVTDHFVFQQQTLKRERVDEDDYFKQYYYTTDSLLEERFFQQKIQQTAGYFQAQYGMRSNWKLIGALQLYRVESNFSLADSGSMTVQDTMLFDKQNQEVTYIQATFPTLTFSDVSWKSSDYSFSLNSMVHHGNISWMTGFARASINDTSIWQLNAGLQHRLFGNSDYYHQLEAFAVIANGSWRPSWKYRMGIKLHRHSWLEAEWLQGRLNNLSDQYGYIIFNHPDLVNRHIEVTFSQGITKNLYLQLRYRNLSSERLFYWYDADAQTISESTNPIQAQTIIGGLKWIF